MADMHNTKVNLSSKNIIQEQMDVSRIMTKYENEIIKATEKIINSCNTQGTKGEIHKSLLLSKIKGLKKLAELYKAVAKKYKNASVKLASGSVEEKVIEELLSYNTFLNDQTQI